MHRREKAILNKDKAIRLNKDWGVNADQARYSEDGHWYATLIRFPAALFDAHGYVYFATKAEYRAASMSIGKQISVPKPGISAMTGYVRVPGALASHRLRAQGEADGESTVVPQSFLPEELTEPTRFLEGASLRVSVNAYERNPEARRRCIDYHGTKCCICSFSFGAMYGAEAEGYIHVHHLRPLSEISDEYEVDPIEDLRPVCPNCHAVLHLGGRCHTIDEVRQLLDQQRHA